MAFLKWLRRVYGRLDESEARSSRPVTDKLVIIEIGCGQSVHSLRFEVELLLKNAAKGDLSTSTSIDPSLSSFSQLSASSVRCIRINPNFATVSQPHIGLPLGSLEALNAIAKRLGIEVESIPRPRLRLSSIIKKETKGSRTPSSTPTSPVKAEATTPTKKTKSTSSTPKSQKKQALFKEGTISAPQCIS